MSEYQVGGSLKANDPTYVTRQADNLLYQKLLQGEFCYIFNCRQMGKSSLRVRTKNRLEQQGYACVSLDMTNIGSQSISPSQWYRSIASEIWRGLNLLDRVSLKQWCQQHSELSPLQYLSLFISDVVLTVVQTEKVVILIDEIDSVLGLNFATDDFFALIRYFYNARAEKPEYNRLNFALFGVATPSELISDTSRTPFNVGTAIELTGFKLEEAKPLMVGLDSKFKNSQQLLNEILNWTGGQPFLTQKLCKLAIESSYRTDKCPDAEKLASWLKSLINEKIINDWEFQDEPEHLKTIRNRLLENETTANCLLGLIGQILQQGSIAADESREQTQLLLTNLVVKHRRRLIIRNPIYRQIFNLDWVNRQSNKLCPYSRELKLWLASQRKDDSRLLRGSALKEARIWSNHHSISQAEYQFLIVSQEQQQLEDYRKLEFDRLKDRFAQEQKLARVQKFSLLIAGTALVMTSTFGILAYRNYQQAKINSIIAENNHSLAHLTSAESLFDAQQVFASLIEALRARQHTSTLNQVNESVREEIDLTLQQAVYNVVEKNTFSGHLSVVNSVSYSKDGKLIASAGSDNTIKIWQRNGKLLHTLRGHRDSVIDVAFSPQENILASAAEDNTVKLWSADGELKNTLRGHLGSVHRVVFSPQGDLLASASGDKTVRLWNRQGGLVNVLFGHEKEVLAVAFSADGQTIATGDRSGTLRLWNRAGKILLTISAHSLPIRGIDFSPDGRRIVTGGDDNLAKIWQLDGREIEVLTGYDAPVTDVKFSPDGKIIATSSWDKSIKLWYPDGTLYADLLGHQGRVWRLAWSPDGETIATAGWDKTVKLWKISKDPLVRTFYGHKASVLDVVFQPQGRSIATASDDRTVKLWQLDGTLQTNFTDHDAEIYNIEFSHDGRLIICTGLDGTIKIWHTDGILIHTFVGHKAPTVDVDFFPGDRRFISGGYDKTIRIWQLNQDGDRLKVDLQQTIFAHQAVITDVDISADGKLIASVSNDRHLKLWTAEGKLIKDLIADHTGLKTVAISPNRQIIATGGKEQNIKLWNADGKLLRVIKGHSASVLDLEFSADGSKLASASADNTIKIWNIQGALLATLRGHRGQVWNIVFSPDGKQLASVSEDTLVKLWNLERILQLDSFQYACDWIEDYLETNLELETESDRLICP